MKIEKIIRTVEDVPILAEKWEILYDTGWDCTHWEVVSQGATFEIALKNAIQKGLKNIFNADLSKYKKFEYRTVEDNRNYVYDSYSTISYKIIHYYIFK